MATTSRRVSMYLQCRTFGHAWRPIPSEGDRHWGDPMWLRCQRCNTERHDAISFATGDLMHRKYVYPDGYQHAFDNDFADAAPTRNDFRRMMLTEQIAALRAARGNGGTNR